MSPVHRSSQTALVIYTTVQQRGGAPSTDLSTATLWAVKVVLLAKAALGCHLLLGTVSVVTHKAGAGGMLWEMFGGGLPAWTRPDLGWVRKKRRLHQRRADYSP